MHFTSSTTRGSFLLRANEVIDQVPISGCTNAKCRPRRAMSAFGGKAENISRDDIGNRSTTGLILILLCQPKSVQTSVIRG
jgi:hypothetical protein